MNKQLEEIIESCRREDGLLDIGKYDDGVLKNMLLKAYSLGKESYKAEVRERIEGMKVKSRHGDSDETYDRKFDFNSALDDLLSSPLLKIKE